MKPNGQTLASRGKLHESKVEEFAAWAEQNGYRREPVPPKAAYEALRLRAVDGGAPILFHRRTHANMFGGRPLHLTVSIDGQRLVCRWLATRREEERKAGEVVER